MRITDQFTFNKTITNTQGGQSSLYKIMQQLSSGSKIQDSYEDASIYIDSSRLEYELATLDQIREATNSAMEMAKNTDQAISDMIKLLEQFKVKLVQAASDGNSQTSREAIAKELTKIKESIINLANTSINGQYLFSGSMTNTKPFDPWGNYYGNGNNMSVVTGSGTSGIYNIPGWDLFFKPDNDYSKHITTNIGLTDNRWGDKDHPEQLGILNGESKWYQFIGQDYVKDGGLDPDKDFVYDDTQLDFPPSSMFIQGVRPDGTSFKATINIDKNSDINSVLENIGQLYGNTADNKVVEVTLNDSGQIEIKNLKEGNSSLDFHAVALTPQFDDKAELEEVRAAAEAAGLSMEDVTNMVMTEAVRGGNATGGADLNDIQSPVTITINGQQFEIDVHQNDFIKSKATDNNGNPADGADYDNIYFEQDGNKVFGNVSQIKNGTSEYATDDTKLSEVLANADKSMTGQVLNLKVTSKGGNEYDVTIDLENSMVSYPDPNNPGQTISFPITHTKTVGNSTQGVITGSEDITYRQLNDIIGMFATDNMPKTSIAVAPDGSISDADYQTLQNGINNSKGQVEVGLDYEGRITITDKLSTNTNIKIALSDANSNKGFPPAGQSTNGSGFVFNANNSLVIDEPNVDLIKDLDDMIDAVLAGNMRADGNSEDPRNTGMQGGIERLDHLLDHLRKQHTIVGAYTNHLEQTNTRATFLSVNVQTIKSNVIDADYVETMMNLMQTQMAYQATMKASTTIAQMSLLNYM
ncbi:flagellar hook-associated protein FlgL [Campylobacter sp. US33a]|uniref:Flagellin n=1 Tax=Campylobacter sp. CCS1377 TaxID=3158229 RepID=A0AAU7E9S9_9BACT|nr:flagellar hook-associated protein FlgL [Campylobacter sp. US33a]TEY02338.1 flagellar hook-associated protein FlgL [Campylobacter sp. US33a]